MFDLGVSKLVLIAIVALIVLGPEKLPRVARTVGALLGKAQRYVNDVKAEVNRSMELDELRKAKTEMENAARGLENTVRTHASDYQKELTKIKESVAIDDKPVNGDSEAKTAVSGAIAAKTLVRQSAQVNAQDDLPEDATKRDFVRAVVPVAVPPRKNWRTHRAATPQWYKARHKVRQKAQSHAARAARLGAKKYTNES